MADAAIKPKPAGYVFGRPTLYRPEFCELLIEHMAAGKSFETFAWAVKVSPDTIYEWENTIADFAEAKKIGTAACQYVFEELGMQGMTAKIPFFHDAIWIFQMKNRFRWTDKMEMAAGPNQDIKTVFDDGKLLPEPE